MPSNELYLEIGKLFLLIIMIITGVSILYWYLKRSFPADDTLDTSFPFYFTHFEPNDGLEVQSPFWASIFIPVILFFCTGIFAWYGTTPNLSAQGFQTFTLISQLPIGLLALAIPFAVLTGRIHGTKQTALQIDKANKQIANTETQIRATEQKNNTDLYLAHYKHFCEHALVTEELLNKRKLFIGHSKISINKRACYKNLYPGSSLTTGIGQLSSDNANNILSELTSIITSSVRLIERSDKSISDFRTLFIENSMILFCSFSKLHINNNWDEFFSPVTFPLPEGAFCYITDFEELLGAVSFMSNVTHKIYQFDSSYHYSETALQFARIALETKLQDGSAQEVITYLNRTGDGIIPTSELDWSELLEASEVTNNGDKMAASI